MPDPIGEPITLGIVEFHSERTNPGLAKRFRTITEDLRGAGCIVDIWLMDIATILKDYGYDMRIYRTPKD